MMAMPEMITNRTDPQTAWGYGDIMRIKTATDYIVETLYSLGYDVDNELQDWKINELPLFEKIDVISNNVESLKQKFYSSLQLDTPSLDFLDLQKANDIERILFEVNAAMERMRETSDNAWTIGIAHTGLYAKVSGAPPKLTLYLETEAGELIADESGIIVDLLTLPKAELAGGTIIIGDTLVTYQTEVQ